MNHYSLNTATLWRVSVNMLSRPNIERQTGPARITIEHNSRVPNELQPRGFHSWKTFRIANSVMEKFSAVVGRSTQIRKGSIGHTRGMDTKASSAPCQDFTVLWDLSPYKSGIERQEWAPRWTSSSPESAQTRKLPRRL